jgi:hypothetical protein
MPPTVVMSRIRLRAADGSEFSFVIDVAPEAVQEEWDRIAGHGLMLLPDRRTEAPGVESHIVWQIWTSSVVGWDATDSDEPISLPSVRRA